MNKVFAVVTLVAALSGCATVMNDTTHPMRVDTKTADGQPIAGADCSATNDKGRFTFKSGDTVQVRRSGKDLDIACTHPGQHDATARAMSRANAGMWGNILIGGAIGAVVDHNKGTAYTYPTWVQLVFGSVMSFDRSDEDKGSPTPGKEVSRIAAAVPSPASAPADQSQVSGQVQNTLQTPPPTQTEMKYKVRGF